MNLHCDPFKIFKGSKSPAGLYARQKWLNESENRRWREDFTETVAALQSYPFPEIHSYREAMHHIRNLFGLHLTVRSSTAGIDDALLQLFSRIDIQSDRIKVGIADGDHTVDLSALPFTKSRPDTLFVSASLFLASIFGRNQDPQVLGLYEWLCEMGIGDDGLWLDKESTHNAFRALVVHPQYCKTRATGSVVAYIAEHQSDEGDWGSRFPFCQTLNALAHLDLPEVSNQLDRAFHHVCKIQNSDGTWGQSEHEWNTFLVVHAMKNRGLL